MTSFIATLLILVSTFVLGGKPVNIPPQLNNEVTSRGDQVSALVKDNDSVIEPSTETAPSEGSSSQSSNSGGNGSLVESGQGGNSSVPNAEKVPAYNNSSEKEMPSDLPQGAIDNSPVLENSEEERPGFESITPPQRPVIEDPKIMIPPPINEPFNPGCGCGSGSGKAESPCVCNN